MSGSLALILHAHLPFVRHPEHDDFFEEDWLFEAITESYLPLLYMMQRLERDRVPFRLTMSVTPTLCAMWQDDLLRARYLRYLERAIDLARRELQRHHGNEPLQKLAQFYFDRLTECRRCYVEEWNCDLVAVLRDLQKTGSLELIASAATHGLLPLLYDSPEAARAQIRVGCEAFRAAFGSEPAGFWLPECAYAPGIEQILADENIRWFVLDTHGLLFGDPPPRNAIYSPCYTAAGPAVFAREGDSSREVWSAEEGYPGDPFYREFYRDIGFEFPLDYLRPHDGPDAPRRFTGLKYHRVTDRDGDKELYVREQAEETADRHATDFLEKRVRQFRELRAHVAHPLIVVPFDAELFGHWWFEGPRFLDRLIRKAAFDQGEFMLATPSEFLRDHPEQQVIVPTASSWGDKGYFEVWLNEKNAWIYPPLHEAARRMTRLARAHAEDHAMETDRVLKQLMRELLLAQASDWAFLMRTGTAREYATKRTRDHLERFTRLHEMFEGGKVDENFLSECEWRDNLFPNVNWRHYV